MTFFKSLPDIVGANALVRLSDIATANNYPTKGKWCQFKSSSGGGSRLGGNEASATRGYPLGIQGYFFAPPNGADITDFADLSMMYVWVATGDTINVLYGG